MATYDIDALKADLPSAKELAQFVYDRTQIALDLVGKPKEEQYLVAKNALEGKKIPAKKLSAAAEKPGTLGRRARLAQTLKKLGK